MIRFNENSIVVTIPFERLGQEVYGDGQTTSPARDGIPQVSGQIPQVEREIPQVIPQVEKEIPQVNASVEEKILAFCVTAKSMLEIADHLGIKDRKTVRKYLNPLIEQGRIARTIPDKPSSRLQKYVTIR